MEEYLWLVMLLNALVDFFLLLGTNRLAGFPPESGRCALAAGAGGVYAGACMLRRFRFLGGLPWRIVSLCLVALVAFGVRPGAGKRVGVFVLLDLAMGGAAVCIGKGDVFAPVLAAVLIWLLCRLAFGETVGGRCYVPVTLCYGGQCVRVTALRDSGNTLRDPVTGEQVLVIGGNLAQKLTGLTPRQLRDPLETVVQRPIPGLRLIPYRTVGQSGGMLLALRFDQVKIGSRAQRAIVAFAPEGLGEGNTVQALAGGI